jgi:hypothetical protein
MIPHVIALEPGLVIFKIYSGYWFLGRPTIEELRHDLRAVLRKCRPDWDITRPELKAAWERDMIAFILTARPTGGVTGAKVDSDNPIELRGESRMPHRPALASPRPDPPARVKALFVGESPPASGRNFYRADSGLYRAIREAFVAADPMFDVNDFLAAFLNVGCYLIDLCTEPVDCLPARDRRLACRASEAQLAEAISDLRPRSVITVVRSIEANVARALAKADWNGPIVSLPYPGRWSTHKTVFVSSLRVALPRLLDDRALSKDWYRQNTSATGR